MTLKPFRLFIILIACTALSAHAENLAVVNGKPIPASALDTLIKAQASRGQPDTPDSRARLKQQLIDVELMSQEGTKLGLDKTPEVKNEVDLARKEIIARSVMTDFTKKNPVSDADIKAEYERYKTEVGSTKEYRAHQLVFDKEEDAKDVIAKLKGGASFEEMAKRSRDASTANGGELDWVPAAKFPKPFGDALAALQKGQLTESPVKTQFGYHVIRLDDSRPARIAPLEEIRPTILNFLTQKKLHTFQQELAKKAKIQ